MQRGIFVSNIGTYADPGTVADLAELAESAGWEALLIWDHLGFVWGPPAGDPWIILAAAAARTERLVLGTDITPLPRRRPHVLAHQVATLDALSGGRVVFGAGIGGVPREFGAFGEEEDARKRAEMLDEGLEVVSRLWAGEEVHHRGRHYIVDGVRLQPRAGAWLDPDLDRRQQPSRPPPGGALRRVGGGHVRTPGDDGEPGRAGGEGGRAPCPPGRGRTRLSTSWSSATPNPVTMSLPAAYESAGATWWLEYFHDARGPLEATRQRIEAGPS